MFGKFQFGKSRASAGKDDLPQIERRWLRSVIAASNEPLPAFPWMRSARAAEQKAIRLIASASQRPTAALFHRGTSPGGLAAR